MPSINHINHIAIVVDDIDAALVFWRDALGLELSHVEDVPEEESIVAFLHAGKNEIELVKPTTSDSGVARYLERRGPGLHHICFEVDDISETLARLNRQGVRLINQEPTIGTGGKKIAFIHPQSTHGVLVELYELSPHEPEIRRLRASSVRDRMLIEGQAVASAALAFLRALRGKDDKRTSTAVREPD